MKSILASLLIISVTVVSFSSCKKYEEGNSFGFTSLNQRVEGEWTYESVVTTDAHGMATDVTADYNGYVLTLLASGTNGSLTTPTTPYTYAAWRFSGSQDHIYLKTGTIETKYEILKLKSQKMWLRLEYPDGSKIEMHFMQ